MSSFARASFAILATLVMSVGFSATQTAVAQGIGSSGIMISEFRFDGPNGSGDEFVEIVNNNSVPKTIVSSDANNLKGFTVWGLVSGSPVKLCTIPFTTLLAPGQHFLCAKSTGYELGGYSLGVDASYTVDLSVDGGVALFSSEDVVIENDGSFSSPSGLAFREDAVGFKKKNSDTNENVFLPLFREGQGLNPIGPQDPANRAARAPNPTDVREYSFVRTHVTNEANGAFSGAVYQDNNSSSGDFQLVANMGDVTFFGQNDFDVLALRQAGSPFDPSPLGFAGTEASTIAVFGAPGPQSKASPIERNYNTQFIRSAFDTGSAIDVSPNRERNGQIVCGGSRGDLILRFTYRNNTTLTQNNLRVRWIDLSTINRNNANFSAVIDLLDSTAATRNLFVNNGRDLRATTTPATANDPAPSADGITNERAAGGAGVKTVRGTYVEGVNKTPPVLGYSSNFLGFTPQNFRQVNPTFNDLENPPGTPCRVGGFNSATVATAPTGPPPSVTTTALPAPLVQGGSISLEHRFGVIRQGTFLIVGIIESN